MALFLSTVTNRVDKKGRVSVPAQFRTALAGQPFQGIVAFRAVDPKAIHASGVDRLETYVEEFERVEFGSDRHGELSALLADARQLAFDTEGRIVLPPDLVEHAGIGEEAAFVGQGRFFFICAPAQARAMVEQPLQRRGGRP